MLYNFYSSIAGIALVVHLIINWRQLVNWRNVNSRVGADEFRHFLVCLLFFFVWDVLWGVFAHLIQPPLFVFCQAMQFIPFVSVPDGIVNAIFGLVM